MPSSQLIELAKRAASDPSDHIFRQLHKECERQNLTFGNVERSLAFYEAKYQRPKIDREAVSSEINEVLSTVFRECPGVNLILMYGYTPGFNDGEPCTHSQSTVVDAYGFCEEETASTFLGTNKYDDEEMYEEEKKAFEEKYGVTLPSEGYHTWDFRDGEKTPTPEQEQQMRAHDLLNNMSDVFQSQYYTNWKLVIARTGEDTFVLDKDEYDCGW